MLRPSNHLEAAIVFLTNPVGPMTIGKLLDNALMPHNKALQTVAPLAVIRCAPLSLAVMQRNTNGLWRSLEL